MTYRDQQKTYLKNQLSTVTVNSVTLPVYDTIYTTTDQYPFATITSGSLKPNLSDTSVYDSGTYRRVYEYRIIVVHNLGGEDTFTKETLIEIDDWENAIINKLQERVFRDGGMPACDDIMVIEVTSPINGLEINLTEGMVFKMFTVECRVDVLY